MLKKNIHYDGMYPLYGMQAVTVRLDCRTRDIINAYYGKNFSQKLRNYIRDSEINKNV